MLKKIVEEIILDNNDCTSYNEVKYDEMPEKRKISLNPKTNALFDFLEKTFKDKYPLYRRYLEFGAFEVKYKPDKPGAMNTAETDGTSITCYDWFLNLSDDNKIFVLFHEINHVMEGDTLVLGNKNINGKIWNIAADLHINHRLVEYLGLNPPEGLLLSPNKNNKKFLIESPVEIIYNRILTEGCDWLDIPYLKDCLKGKGHGKGHGKGQGNGENENNGENGEESDEEENEGENEDESENPDPLSGDIKPMPESMKDKYTERNRAALKDLKRSSLQAGQGEGLLEGIDIGDLSSNVPEDWKAILNQYIGKYLIDTTEYRSSFSPRSKRPHYEVRHDYRMVYPSFKEHRSEKHVKNIYIAIDTSGSVMGDIEIVRKFLSTIKYILKSVCKSNNPCVGKLIFFHDKIYKVVDFPPIPEDDELKKFVKETGGTDFRPIFTYIKEQHEKEKENLRNVSVLVVLTDGEAEYPKVDREKIPYSKDIPYPVLWTITPDGKSEVPFGKIIKINE